MLTMTTNKAYCEPATAKSVVGSSRLDKYQSAQAPNRSVFFYAQKPVYGGLCGGSTERCFSDYSPASSTQPATLLPSSTGGSSLNNQRTSPCHRFTSYTFYSALQSATLSILDIAYTSLSETLTSLRKVWRCAMSHTKPWIDVRRFHRLHRGAWKHREYEYPFVFENLSGGHRLPHVGMHFASRTALRQSAKGWRVI